MIKISTESRYARNVHTVQLSEEEQSYPDNRLITMADRYYKLPDDEWEAIEAGAHPGHFGGKVIRKEDGTAEIHVYID